MSKEIVFALAYLFIQSENSTSYKDVSTQHIAKQFNYLLVTWQKQHIERSLFVVRKAVMTTAGTFSQSLHTKRGAFTQHVAGLDRSSVHVVAKNSAAVSPAAGQWKENIASAFRTFSRQLVGPQAQGESQDITAA